MTYNQAFSRDNNEYFIGKLFFRKINKGFLAKGYGHQPIQFNWLHQFDVRKWMKGKITHEIL